jgi:hypothetical protein
MNRTWYTCAAGIEKYGYRCHLMTQEEITCSKYFQKEDLAKSAL